MLPELAQETKKALPELAQEAKNVLPELAQETKKALYELAQESKKALSEVTQEMKKQAGAELGQAQLKLELDWIEQVMTGRDRLGQGWIGRDM